MKTVRRWWKWILLGIVVILLLVAWIPALPVVGKNPPVISEPTWDSPTTEALVRRACYDCHSNETEWPWYSYVPPTSLLMLNHVQEGREYLNFSEWGQRRQELDEIVEVVRNGEMPPQSYIWLHPQAQLTEQEQEQLITGLQQSLNLRAEGTEGRKDDDDD